MRSIMTEISTEINRDVRTALEGLDIALNALNYAGEPYARESDGPYGAVKAAAVQVVELAVPGVSGRLVLETRVDNGETLNEALNRVACQIREATHEFTEALRGVDSVTRVVVEPYYNGHNEETAAPHFLISFVNGCALSVIPDDGRPEWWQRAQSWEALPLRGEEQLHLDNPGNAVVRGTGLSELLDLARTVAALD